MKCCRMPMKRKPSYCLMINNFRVEVKGRERQTACLCGKCCLFWTLSKKIEKR